MLTQCSSPAGDDENEAKRDPLTVPAGTTNTNQEPESGPVVDSSDQPCVKPSQEPVVEDQKRRSEEALINLSEEMKGAVFLWLHICCHFMNCSHGSLALQ